ncbi:hypothetical protein C8Q77DRAFT_929704 [Trametes polyzona]|nr:hypothetical protein C8Q77DRAFT_929704 [Trametes polyzona]
MLNPFVKGRMASNLNRERRGNGHAAASAGNHTAKRTVLSPGAGTRSSAHSYAISGDNPNKRQKIEPAMRSGYFANGNAGTGKGKGKEKAFEFVEVLSDDEDRGEVVPRPAPQKLTRGSSTPDPLDCIADRSTSRNASPKEVHPFERGIRASGNRLPPDGAHTARLREKHKAAEAAEVVDLEAPSDDIESASAFDQTDDDVPPPRKIATPHGRGNIRPGIVSQNRLKFESQDTPQGHSSAKGNVPTLDLTKQGASSRKAAMKSRDGKLGNVWLALLSITAVRLLTCGPLS